MGGSRSGEAPPAVSTSPTAGAGESSGRDSSGAPAAASVPAVSSRAGVTGHRNGAQGAASSAGPGSSVVPLGLRVGTGAGGPGGEHGNEGVAGVDQVVGAGQVAAAESVDERVVGAYRGQIDRLVAEQGVEQQVVVEVPNLESPGLEVQGWSKSGVVGRGRRRGRSRRRRPRSPGPVAGGAAIRWAVRRPGSVGRSVGAGTPAMRRPPDLRPAPSAACFGSVESERASSPSHRPGFRTPCPPHGPHWGPPHTSSARHELLLRIVLALYRRRCVKPTCPHPSGRSRHPDGGPVPGCPGRSVLVG